MSEDKKNAEAVVAVVWYKIWPFSYDVSKFSTFLVSYIHVIIMLVNFPEYSN